jgi:hypothetical protein
LSSSGYNLIGNTEGGSGFAETDLLNVEPLLGPLQENGGGTLTHTLLPESPAIDAGDNANAPPYDQRGTGFPRIVGGTIDIGAFEVQPAAPIRLVLIASPQVTAGVPFDIRVTAFDAYRHIASGYTGSVSFTGSDPLPADYIFMATDQGTHIFSGTTFFTAGLQTLSVQDTANGSLAASTSVTVTAAQADHFVITAPATAVSGMPFDLAVTALDPFGNVATGYAGTINWSTTDTDPAVILRAAYTFQSTDGGMHTFLAEATLITRGDQTITATDPTSGLTGMATITVTGGAAPGGARRGGSLLGAAIVDEFFALLGSVRSSTSPG